MDCINLNVLFSFKHLNMEMLPEIEEFVLFKQQPTKNKKKYYDNYDKNKKRNYKKPFQQKQVNVVLIEKRRNRDDDEKIMVEMRSILNKISVDNMEKMSDKILLINIPSLEILKFLCELLFEKAIVEHKYSELYATISKKFLEIKYENITLRKLLLDMCQQTFIKFINLEYPDTFKLKGFIKYLGELYCAGIFFESLSLQCIKMMINSVKENKKGIIMMMCVYLRTILDKFKNTTLFLAVIKSVVELKSIQGIELKEKFAIMDFEDLIKKL